MKRSTAGATVRIGTPLWTEIMVVAVQDTFFATRSNRDATALSAAIGLLREDRERRASSKRVTLLRLPSDPRQLCWLRKLVRRCGARNWRVRHAAARVVNQICQHSSALAPYARALHQEWLDASPGHDRKVLALRLCNLGYVICMQTGALFPHPEGCATALRLRLRWAGKEGWLSGHLRTQLARERAHGLLE